MTHAPSASARPSPIALEVEGATEEQLAFGVAAAKAVFERRGVDPVAAAEAHWKRDCWDDLDPTGPGPTPTEHDAANVWAEADDAAIEACCAGWPRLPSCASLVLADDAAGD